MIVDAHLHLPVGSGIESFEQAGEKLVADMRQDGVEHAVLIPDNVAGSAIGDVPACLELVSSHPELSLLGTINLETQGRKWIEELDRMLAHRLLVGMKIFPGHDPIYPTDSRLDPVYDLCQIRGVPMVIHTGWNSGDPEVARFNDPQHIARVLERFRELNIVVSHMFWPEVDRCYKVLHDFPQVYYDTSALADAEVVAATGEERIRNVLLKLLAEDPGKVIFGTDYAECDRTAHIELIKQLPIASDVRERIFWRNAADVFNLPLNSCR